MTYKALVFKAISTKTALVLFSKSIVIKVLSSIDSFIVTIADGHNFELNIPDTILIQSCRFWSSIPNVQRFYISDELKEYLKDQGMDHI